MSISDKAEMPRVNNITTVHEIEHYKADSLPKRKRHERTTLHIRLTNVMYIGWRNQLILPEVSWFS